MKTLIFILISLLMSLVSTASKADSCEAASGYTGTGNSPDCDQARIAIQQAIESYGGYAYFTRSPATRPDCVQIIIVGHVYTAIGYRCPVVCPAAGTQKSTGFYNLGTDENASIPNIGCDGGCITIYSGYGITKRAMINGVYNYFYGAGSYNYNGESCTSGQASRTSTPGVPPNTCNPETQQKGEVNGVTVCLPKSQSNTTNTTTSPPVTDPATGNTNTTTNTTVNNTTNNTTTNTTTTTTTAPDGTKSETKTETTTKNPPTNFCQQNPTDPTCVKNSQVCEDNPEILGCKTLGTVEDGIVGTAEQGISSITPKSIGGSGSCPAPITTSFMGRTITFSYDLPCQAAGMLKPLILALAWLGAGIIFIGGVRQ